MLSATLIAVPVAGFVLVERALILPPADRPAAQGVATLGDLSAYAAIVTDTQAIAATGDLVAAEKRITDLETLWDDNAQKLRAADPAAWGVVDAAADAAFKALRSAAPDAGAVKTTLAALQAALAAPVPTTTDQPIQRVQGFAVTDATGRPLPCEQLLGQLKDRLADKTATAAVADLQAKALERCNADDDARANAFSAQALAQLNG